MTTISSATSSELVYAKPWVPPLISGRLKSFLYKNGKLETFKKGAVLVSEDDYLDEIFILKSGVLSNAIIHHELNKSFMMCGIRLPGHISGYTTFLMRDPAPVRITALAPTETYCVHFDVVDRFLDANPDLKVDFIRYCGRCLRSEIDALLAITTLPTEDRFWSLMAAIISTLMSVDGIETAANSGEWLVLPFKISRETMSGLLYVSTMTVDRMYAALIKDGLMRRTKGGYSLSAKQVDAGMKWIQARYAVTHMRSRTT